MEPAVRMTSFFAFARYRVRGAVEVGKGMSRETNSTPIARGGEVGVASEKRIRVTCEGESERNAGRGRERTVAPTATVRLGRAITSGVR